MVDHGVLLTFAILKCMEKSLNRKQDLHGASSNALLLGVVRDRQQSSRLPLTQHAHLQMFFMRATNGIFKV